MLSSLDVLTKAANYVENQERNGFEPRRNGTQPTSATRAVPKASLENGGPGHNTVTYPPHIDLDETKHSKEVRSAMNHHRSSDEPGNPQGTVSNKSESMRLNDRSPGEDTSMANYNHSNGVLHQRMYQDDRHLLSSYRNCSTESPTRSLSPVAKRPQSPSNPNDSEHGPRAMVLPHPLTSMAGVSGHPMAHFAPHNPMLPFLNPFMYPAAAFDPNVCAETFARQQGMALSGEVERQQQQSPGSSPNAASSSAGITPAALQGFMYPLAANPAYLMGARVSQTPGMGLADIPMLFPSQIAAYGANMLPGQVPALGLSEQDKRVYESLPGFAQHTQAHLLANPYFKSFCAPTAATNIDAISATKDAAAAAAAAAATGATIPGMPGYSLEVLLKYQEALANEAMKMKGILSPQQSSPSPAPRRSSSPESSKKPHLVAPYPFSVPFPPAYLTNPNVALSKSPAPERKVSTPTMGALKNGSGVPPSHHQQQQDVAAARAARERELMYAGNNHDLGMNVNGDEARRRLMALAQRPRNPSDLYASPYKGPHDRTDRRSPSPYNSNDRRRISRERSPGRSLSADKSAKKRSHESSYGSEPKSRSPNLQHQIDGNRATKSPHRRSSSPMSRIAPRHSQGANPYLAVPGAKPTQDKETPSYLTQTPPYAFPQTLGGFPGAPYALQSYLRQADPNAPAAAKSSIAGFTAPAFSAAQTSQLYRSPAPVDAAALAEYSRLAGLPPYAAIALLMPQQQQALRQSVIAHATQSTQSLLDKERGSPVVNPMLQAHSRTQAKMATRESPIPQQHISSSASTNATSKAPKMAYAPGLPYPYGAYSKSRTPPGYQELPIKREATSPQARRASHLPTFSSKVGGNTVRSSDEERANRLKRKVHDEDEERAAGKDVGVKQRKREINADPNAAADIEEHFRRSLGEKYKKEAEPVAHQQIVNITSSVDDHFQKALGGDVWSRLKTSNKPSSPEAPEALERREAPAPFRGDISMPPAQHLGIHPTMYLPVQADSRHLLYAQSGKLPPNGNKTVKARAVIYPEAPQIEPASRTYSSNSSSSRSDRSSPPPSKLDLGYTNKFLPESKPRIPAYQASTAPALNCRSTQSPVKEVHYPEHEGARHPGASPVSKQPPPYTIAPSSYGGSPTATVPPPYSPQTTSSATKSSPPPRQATNDSQSPNDLQDQMRAKSRYLAGLET